MITYTRQQVTTTVGVAHLICDGCQLEAEEAQSSSVVTLPAGWQTLTGQAPAPTRGNPTPTAPPPVHYCAACAPHLRTHLDALNQERAGKLGAP